MGINNVHINIYNRTLEDNVVLYGQYISIGYIEQHVHFPHYPHYFPHFFPHWNYLSNSGARKRLIVLISTNVSTPI